MPSPGQSFNDLHPTESAQFVENLSHPGVGPSDLKPGSDNRVVWRCPTNPGHTWIAPVYKRSKGSGCGVCWAERGRGERLARLPTGATN